MTTIITVIIVITTIMSKSAMLKYSSDYQTGAKKLR